MNARAPISLWPDPAALGSVTDLYELTMMAGYHAAGIADHPATFELFVRKLPPGRAYLVFAGLEQVLGDLARLAFSPEQVASLRGSPAFARVSPAFFDWIGSLRFRCDVHAVAEGTVVFPGETIVRVEGPLAQAQWIETLLIASLNYPTLVASKAARIVEAARGRTCIDFGARRGHGPHAGFLAARAAYIAGFVGTSYVEAARRLGIPAVGSMAHAWVQAFSSEAEAFAIYARTFPESAALLVDTYDTREGVRSAARIEPPVKAIRIDSGDFAALSFEARRILDAAGRGSVSIMVSGDLEERRIAELLEAGAPIDAFGVGTELITSRDAPALPMVYKLTELNGRGRVKKSPGKRTYPLGKQVWRRRDGIGRFAGDHVTRSDETADGEPLLKKVMAGGEIVGGLPSIEAIRQHARDQVAALPVALRGVDAKGAYPITYSEALERAAREAGL